MQGFYDWFAAIYAYAGEVSQQELCAQFVISNEDESDIETEALEADFWALVDAIPPRQCLQDTSTWIAAKLLACAYMCPIRAISAMSRRILAALQQSSNAKQLLIGNYQALLDEDTGELLTPSSFLELPPEHFKSLFTTDPKVSSILVKIFSKEEAVSNVHLLFTAFPDLLTRFVATSDTLFYGPGPLPPAFRLYIALMAASRHQCEYLARRYILRLLALAAAEKDDIVVPGQGPIRQWITDGPPPKLRVLQQLNAYLAHQPWNLNAKTHIQSLVEDPSNPWTIAEVVFAIAIMSHTHSLASLVLSLGINFDVCFASVAPSISTVEKLPWTCVPCPCEEHSRSEIVPLIHSSSDREDERSAPRRDLPRVASMTEAGALCCMLNDADPAAASPAPQPNPHKCGTTHINFEKYCGAPDVVYTSRISRSSTGFSLHYRTFNWADHGIPLIERYCPGLGLILSEENTFAERMTDGKFGNEACDTTKFRRMITAYIQNLFGVILDDFDYSFINKATAMAECREFKLFVRESGCRPEVLTARHLAWSLPLRTLEKVHVSLLVMYSRRMAELMLGLHAVNAYNSSR